MIVVKIELWPYGDKKKKQKLYELKISNISNNLVISDYSVVVNNGSGIELLREVINKHVRSKGLFVLLKKVFNKITNKNIEKKQKNIELHNLLLTFLEGDKKQ